MWNDLNMAQRNELIKLYLNNGISSLDKMKEHYNSYQDGGKMTFQQWKSQMQSKYPDIEMDNTKAGYDYVRYFNDNYDDAIRQLSNLQHFPDTYKLPNHPTFSNESIYSRGPMIGGSWGYAHPWDTQWSNTEGFTPSIVNRQIHPEIYKEDRPYTEREIYKPQFVQSSEQYYDRDNDIIYSNDFDGEGYQHEYFHARPDYNLLNNLRPYYENLNDEKLSQLGADLPFVKRFENDPSHFYSPEELGARVYAARYMLNRAGINTVDIDFLRNARQNELQYGDNFRDLLHMYNDENLLQILNTQYSKGGHLYQDGSKPDTISSGRWVQVDNETVTPEYSLPPITIEAEHPLWSLPWYKDKKNNPNINRYKDQLYNNWRRHNKTGKEYIKRVAGGLSVMALPIGGAAGFILGVPDLATDFVEMIDKPSVSNATELTLDAPTRYGTELDNALTSVLESNRYTKPLAKILEYNDILQYIGAANDASTAITGKSIIEHASK